MTLLQNFKHAGLNILSSKLRSFLAMLGILVGTASVVTLVTSAQLATIKALSQLKSMGTDLLAVSVYPESYSPEPQPGASLSYRDIVQLRERSTMITQVAPYTSLFQPINFQGKKINGGIVAATDDLKRAVRLTLKKGHFVSIHHQHQRYCVLGEQVAKQMKGKYGQALIGKQLWIGQHIYTIIGELEHWRENAFFNANANRSVFIPLPNAQLIDKNASIQNLIVTLDDDDHMMAAKTWLTQTLKQVAPKLKVFIRSPAQIIEGMEKQSQIFSWLLGLIGGISLLVGGIGVMNIMLVSVTERRREIGLLKAVGARRRDVVHLFLAEAVILALLGGCMGVLLGQVVSFIIAYFAGWDFVFLVIPPLIGFGVSATTGIFFGFYPAYRAANLNPIEALRYE